MTQVAFGGGRVLELGVNVSAEAMEAFACALAVLPRNARVTVSVDRSDGDQAPLPASRMEELLDWVAYEMGVARLVIIGPSRVPSAVRARDAFSWGACALLGRTKPEVARLLGGRDPTTVGEATRRAEKLRQSDPALKALTLRMAAMFAGAVS